MVHPGYFRDITGEETRLLQSREQELQTLTDATLRDTLTNSQIRLIAFNAA